MDPISSEIIPCDHVAAAAKASPDRVKVYWPILYDAMKARGIEGGWSQIAMIATVAVETAHQFAPIREFASGEAYEGRLDLGNSQPGDGPRFKGRGFIQITGRLNYRSYGQRLEVNLEGDPDAALRPNVAAQIAALYFADRHIPEAAAAGNWRMVRKKVNGGYNGWEDFADVLRKLGVVV